MKNEFDFYQIGKQMPYTVPDGFFDTLENNIRQELALTPDSYANKRKRHIRIIMRSITAAAAVSALFLVLNVLTGSHKSNNFADIEQAFDNLSDDDRAYTLQVYGEDIFMNEQSEKQ